MSKTVIYQIGFLQYQLYLSYLIILTGVFISMCFPILKIDTVYFFSIAEPCQQTGPITCYDISLFCDICMFFLLTC